MNISLMMLLLLNKKLKKVMKNRHLFLPYINMIEYKSNAKTIQFQSSQQVTNS